MVSVRSALGLVLVLMSSFGVAQAQTCTSSCGSRQIQLTPGQSIRVQLTNRTSSLVQVEQVFQTSPISLLPGQEFELDSQFGTQPNTSIVFWDETSLPVRAVLSRPETDILRVEILPGGNPPGDRSIYIENDGKVAIF